MKYKDTKQDGLIHIKSLYDSTNNNSNSSK